MTYDPNLPPNARDRIRDPAPAPRSGSIGWMIGLLILALVVVGAFFVWPNRTADVAGGNSPATTGSTPSRPTAPAPSDMTPAPEPAPAPAPAPAAPR